ncbi:hypothetical protein ACFL2G_03905 [Candidatus Omnitrophota bacterium]
MIMIGFLATDILFCGLEKEKCPYAKNTQPHAPEKHYNYAPPPYNNIVMASGSTTFLSFNPGQYIKDLPDGKKVYYLNPTNISIVGGKLRIIDNEGKERNIDFETLQE